MKRNLTRKVIFFMFYTKILTLFLTLFMIAEFIIVDTVYAILDSDKLFQNNPNEPWNILADEIIYDQKKDQYLAKGNINITQKNKKLASDFARFDMKTMNTFASGNVIMIVGEDVLTGDSMEVNLKSETGTIYNGTIFLKANHFYIKGSKIQKYNVNSYSVEKASVTSCDGKVPAWKITGRRLNVTLEGYGKVSNVTLWVKNIPTAYLPYLVFPAKTKRQSGLLAPQFGNSSRKGEEYIQPFYWAINESSDATWYQHHMGSRGEKGGFEYRYVLDEISKGTLMFDYFNDRKIDDGKADSGKISGYTDDNYLRPNDDRYWFRMKHDQALPSGFLARLDLDVVSDQDYLTEFRNGYTGYGFTQSYYNSVFGRQLDDYNDPIRLNTLNISKSFNLYNFNTGLRWYDNVINRRQNSDQDPTLQKFPFIEFSASKQPISNSMFYYDFNSEYDKFYRTFGTTGNRIDLHPRLYLPLRPMKVFSFESSVGIRETAWFIDKFENESPYTSRERFQDRQLYDVMLDLSTELSRIFNFNIQGIDKIKNTIRPQLIYQYIPNVSQDKFPFFDTIEDVLKDNSPLNNIVVSQTKSIDRIPATNLITYPIYFTFTSRSLPLLTDNESKDQSDKSQKNYIYNQFCRIKLEQSYNINEAREDNSANWSTPTQRRPFSPVLGEIYLSLIKYFSLQADTKWSPYDKEYQSHNLAMNISDERGDNFFIEHRYEQFSKESIFLSILCHLTDKILPYASYERNIFEEKDIRKSVGVFYQSQCWSIDLRYADELNEDKFEFWVNLYGLGGLGQRNDLIKTPESAF